MELRLWGVRGSIPAPGPDTVVHGGNTTCIEVREDSGELIVLDAGTGIRGLGLALARQMPVTAHLFITHSHWDHIHGLPFFVPLFVPGNRVIVHGPPDLVTGEGIERVMNVQMQYSYFPVREAELRATLDYRTLSPGESVAVGKATVTPVLLNHPVLDYGYRIDCGDKSCFFTGDHEPHANLYPPEDPAHASCQALVDERQAELLAAIAGVDLIVADCAYGSAEYASRRGWGHGTFASSIRMAKEAGARRLVCTHHEPTRSDAELLSLFDAELAAAGDLGGLQVVLAREGDAYDW